MKKNCYCNIFVRFIFSILCSWTVVQSGSCAALSEGKNHTTLPDAFMAGANFTIQRCKILQFSSPEPQGKDIDKPSLNMMGFPVYFFPAKKKLLNTHLQELMLDNSRAALILKATFLTLDNVVLFITLQVQ